MDRLRHPLGCGGRHLRRLAHRDRQCPHRRGESIVRIEEWCALWRGDFSSARAEGRFHPRPGESNARLAIQCVSSAGSHCGRGQPRCCAEHGRARPRSAVHARRAARRIACSCLGRGGRLAEFYLRGSSARAVQVSRAGSRPQPAQHRRERAHRALRLSRLGRAVLSVPSRTAGYRHPTKRSTWV